MFKIMRKLPQRITLLGAFLLMSINAFGQEDVPFEVYGIWQSVDNEFLRVYRTEDGKAAFQRVSGRSIKAMGIIEFVDGEMHITRGDKKDEYSLAYFLGNDNMVIAKPNSNQAWLWSKVGS